MNSFTKILLSLLAMSAIGSAVAAPISMNQTVTATKTITGDKAYSFIFDINSDFKAGLTELTTGMLTFRLSDPSGGNEKFNILLGADATAQSFTKDGHNHVNNGRNVSLHTVELGSDALADLNADGLLKIMLTVNAGGNYVFEGMTLLAEGERIPEPFSLALIGIALAGFGAARRRK